MKKEDLAYVTSALLLFCLIITALLGYIQSELELRKFVPHRYFAYITLILTVVHIFFHFKRLWRYVKRRF